MSVRRIENAIGKRARSADVDEFDDDGIDDDELVQAALGDLEFDHIENYSNPTDAITHKNTSKNAKAKAKGTQQPTEKVNEDDGNEPRQLENGKWACNHKCRDKKICKHMCCREGIDKPPRKPIKRKPAQDNEIPAQADLKNTSEKGKKTQTTLQLTASKRKTLADIEELDMTQHEKKRKAEFATSGPLEYRNLHRLHSSVQKKDPRSSISSIVHKQPAYHYETGGDYTLSFMEQEAENRNSASDYGGLEMEGLNSHFDRPKSSRAEGKSNLREQGIDFGVDLMSEVTSRQSDMFDDDDSIFRDAMLGLTESEYLQTANENKDHNSGGFQEFSDMDYDMGIQYDETLHNEPATRFKTGAPEEQSMSLSHEYPTSSSVEVPTMQPEKGRSLFVSDTSDVVPVPAPFRPHISKTRRPKLEELRQTEVMPPLEQTGPSKGKAKEREPETKSKFDDDENTCVELAGPHEPQKSELEQRPVPGDFKDLEPWLFAEFGDIIELVDE
jgi:ATP-dependent DNA helicase HFM1/MER3